MKRSAYKCMVLVATVCATAFLPSVCFGQYINGYAVSNHRSCGANNLPGTVQELDKFFASSYFPEDAQKNVYWKNGDVQVKHWEAGTDLFDSSDALSGTDGVDAPLISYIASHGGTNSGRYTALAGGADGCNIRSSNIGAGDGNARYLVLSTCQGLKIGTGDNPNRAGENPSVTWKDANKGLNCIFGYSNNMVDDDDYGNYFLENLATSDDTLAKAFMRASRRISTSNISAVLCFGPDDASAREYLESTKRFTSERTGTGGSAWTHDRAKIVEGSIDPTLLKSVTVLPRIVQAKIPGFSPDRLATSMIGAKAQDQSVGGTLNIFRSSVGTVTYNQLNGYFSFVKRAKPGVSRDSAMKIDDQAAMRIASTYLMNRSFMAPYIGAMKPVHVIDRYIGSKTGSDLVEKTVIMAQSVSGVSVLGTAGTVEVTIGSEGDVREVHGALIELAKPRVAELLDVKDVSIKSAEEKAMQSLAKKMPGSKLALVQTLVGFDSGDYSARVEKPKLVAEVLVEVSKGGFARRYIERVAL